VRYFVFHRPDTTDVHPHILAEVVRESFDDGRFREWSAAANIAGDRCEVLTRGELEQRPDGVRALLAWETRDDRQFDRDTRRILETIEREEALASENGPHLRLVPDEAVAGGIVAADPRIELLAARRRIRDAVRLRKEAQRLIEIAQVRRRAAPSPNGSARAEDTGGQ
jgi:hypothetical protein